MEGTHSGTVRDSDASIIQHLKTPVLSTSLDLTSISTQTKKPSKIQVNRSGTYAILVALIQKELQCNYRGFMTNTELKQDCQRHFDKLFTKKDDKNCAFWSGMDVLLHSRYVVANKEYPTEYSLTDKGRIQARYFLRETIVAPLASSSSSGAVRYLPVDYEFVLFVDTSQMSYPSNSYDELGVPHEVYRLTVGDFVWVVRKKKCDKEIREGEFFSPNIDSLVLPFVVQRNKYTDLSESIKTKRFEDQRQRLKDTKLQVTYLLEGVGNRTTLYDNGPTTTDFINNLENDDKFIIKKTESFQETLIHLAEKTREYMEQYKDKTMVGFWKSQKENFQNAGNATEAHLMFFSDFIDYSCSQCGY